MTGTENDKTVDLETLLRQVENGGEVLIHRQGRPVARLVPVRPRDEKSPRSVARTIEELRALRRRLGLRAETMDWNAWRRTGRR